MTTQHSLGGSSAEQAANGVPLRRVVVGGGLYLLFWLTLMFNYVRPQEMLHVTHAFGLPTLSGVILALFWLFKGDKSILSTQVMKGVTAFWLLMVISVIATKNQNAWLQVTSGVAMTVLTITIPVAAFLTAPEQLTRVLKAFVLFHTIVALWVITHNGFGPTPGFLGDENDACLALDVALPYAWFIAQSPCTSPRGKFAFLLMAGIILVGIVSTGSRGGFLGMGVVAAGIFFLSPNKMRNLMLGAVFGVIMIAMAPQKFWNKFASLTDSKEASANERLEYWQLATSMFIDHPVIGVGAGNFPWRAAEYHLRAKFYRPGDRLYGGRQAHSIYFTMLPELGILGVAAFAWIVTALVRMLGSTGRTLKSRERTPLETELFLLNRGATMSLLAFLSAGAFLAVLYYPHLWVLCGFTLAIDRAIRTNAAAAGMPRTKRESGRESGPAPRYRFKRPAKSLVPE